jgi:hypothetical protein
MDDSYERYDNNMTGSRLQQASERGTIGRVE